MVDATPHDNHGAPLRPNCIIRKLTRCTNHNSRIHTCIFLLPFWRIWRILFIRCCGFPAKSTVNPIVSKYKIIDRCHTANTCRCLKPFDWDSTLNCPSLTFLAKIRQNNRHNIIFAIQQRQLRCNFGTSFTIFFPQIPFFRLIPAITHGPIRYYRHPCQSIQEEMLELSMLAFPPHVMSIQKTARNIMSILLIKQYQKRHICIFFRIINKKFCRVSPVVFMQNDMSHSHRKCTITSCLDVKPCICCCCRFRIIR